MKVPEVEADEILKLKDMFPDTPIMMIQSIYDRKYCRVSDSCEELLLTSTSEAVQSDSNEPPGSAQGPQMAPREIISKIMRRMRMTTCQSRTLDSIRKFPRINLLTSKAYSPIYSYSV